jgi:hypothetical protein
MAGFPSAKKGDRRADKAKSPKPGLPFDKDIIADLIKAETGNVSRVADRIGTSRGAMRNFIDRHPELQQLLKDQRERQIDELERSVFDRAIDEKDTTLQLFLLKTQGRHRGYDQDDAKKLAGDIASAAFEFVVNRSKNPAEPSQ